LYNETLYLLPEGLDIRNNKRGVTLNSNNSSNIVLNPAVDSEMFVTFVSEGAGYLNSVGYFLYEADNPPTSRAQVTTEKIIFANASMDSPLNRLTSAKQFTVSLGKITPLVRDGRPVKTAVGFFIVSNGFKAKGRDGKPGVNETQDPNWVFYSLRELNPEPRDSRQLNVHTVLLANNKSGLSGAQQMVVGFEDIKRDYGGDHDFNDVILAVTVTPKSAITNLDDIPNLALASDPDSDGDGVKDSLDEFPNDAAKAFSRYYPDKNSYGTLAYEDNWPVLGDFDMNDIVVRYRTREIMNASRSVVGLEVDYKLAAQGGVVNNGFAVQLPGIANSGVASATLETTSSAGVTGSPVTAPTETDAKGVVFKIFNKALENFAAIQNCSFANTDQSCGAVTGAQFKLTVNFTSPLDLAKFTPPYNAFIFQTGKRGHEIHLPGQQPTSSADASLFKTGVDNTSSGTSNTYMTASRLPWALDIPAEWLYPQEKIGVLTPYPKLIDWANAGGVSHKDWYINGVVPATLFIKKP
jgi:LruC domain-containing protein